MSTRERSKMRYAISALGVAAASVVGVGCWPARPCDPGQRVVEDQCEAPPAAAAAAPGDAGDSGAEVGDSSSGAHEGGEAAVATTFGRTCTTAAECAGGDAPVCGAPQVPVCTQTDCLPGQAHAGVCPTGWMCFDYGGGSVCLEK